MTDSQFNQIATLLNQVVEELIDINSKLSNIESNTGIIGTQGAVEDVKEAIETLTKKLLN